MSSKNRLGLALLGSSLVSCGLWAVAAVGNDSLEFGYFIWNLSLAWIPLGLALWLEKTLRVRLWSSWPALALTGLWLLFLPNSFYVISDFVHLTEVPRVDIVFDVAMFASFGINGLMLGYLSLFIIHNQLTKRISLRAAGFLVGATLLASSFAIYIGRDLRWNTWDILVNPASLLFDISDRLINFGRHPQVLSTTISFFLLLGSIYLVIWYAANILRRQKV